MIPDAPRKPIRWQYTLIVTAALFLLLWDPVNLWWNFHTVNVEVKSVRALCTAIGPIFLEVDECATLRQRHQNAANIAINPRTFVSFDYVSPVDGKTHTASLALEQNADGAPIAVGDRIDIDVSRKQLGLVRPR